MKARDTAFGAVYHDGPAGRATLPLHPRCSRFIMPRMPSTPDEDDPLAAFELPPEIMSQTFEHAISDDASVVHERGHAVAAALQKKLKGSVVEYGYPGLITVHLKSGAVARCGGPTLGWMIDLQQQPAGETDTIDVDVADDETDPAAIADALAKKLKRR
jgi:hypothetical protein